MSMLIRFINLSVQVLAGIELIVFPVAAMVLCSGFRIRTTTHPSFSCCRDKRLYRDKAFSSWCYRASEKTGGAPGAGRGCSWDSWHTLTPGMSHR